MPGFPPSARLQCSASAAKALGAVPIAQLPFFIDLIGGHDLSSHDFICVRDEYGCSYAILLDKELRSGRGVRA